MVNSFNGDTLDKLNLYDIYQTLLEEYGTQGWWPLFNVNGDEESVGPFYHPNDYSYPRNRNQKFEIAVGAILTQNTSWRNATKALVKLYKKNLLQPVKLERLKVNKLIDIIRSAGFFRRKSKSLKNISKYFLEENPNLNRKKLLNAWGIGKETADSILLYAFKKNYFIVDAYTKRIISRLNIVEDAKLDEYESFRKVIEKNIPSKTEIYQEYHALFVKHAKKYCRKTPVCRRCVLKEHCQYPNLTK